MDNVSLYFGILKPYIAKVTCQSNVKTEPDKQPSSKDEHKIDVSIPDFKKGSQYIPHPRYRRPPPNNADLPPRTTRADFITPDQRAIYGPAITPFEMTDRVKPDRL